MDARLSAALAAAAMALTAVPIAAQAVPGWGGPGWRGADWQRREAGAGRRADPRIGRIEVARFRADAPGANTLGKGAVSVTAAGDAESALDQRERATFEAAVVDSLAGAGYDVASADPAGGQIAELRITRTEAEPAEPPHKPVSGAMTMGVSNRGSMMGMAVAVDLTKPRGALYSTRLSARIRDRASGAVLWEGRADILTRAGDPRWDDQHIAERLAAALFAGFPARTGEETLRR